MALRGDVTASAGTPQCGWPWFSCVPAHTPVCQCTPSRLRMGVQASQNRIAREARHPGLSRWKQVSALPSHATSNCSPPGLSRWKPGLQTGASPIRGQTGVPLGQAPRGRFFRVRVVVQKLAPTGTRPAVATPFLKGNPQFKTGQTTRPIPLPLDSRNATIRPLVVQDERALITHWSIYTSVACTTREFARGTSRNLQAVDHSVIRRHEVRRCAPSPLR